VLGPIAEDLGNSQIADRLSIGEKTVRTRVSNLVDELGVPTRAPRPSSWSTTGGGQALRDGSARQVDILDPSGARC
jgi:hypothetical protein